ncbi:tyrosine-type recombinase/integrase [Methylibium rhizosphaerae]|uniref:tyrosine-type recombinase/integrase n=1 Tax=Methylibium rhizosphaerae TaxID=2570323 RepID=UPI001129437A|nr:integrase arm-type DNA-binding domain-containing protein [Methylibium rhizosphaerae]
MARDLITSDTTIRSIKPGDPRKRLTDGAGLYLLLFVKGGAHGWRFDYTFAGKRKTLSLGTYPDTGLGAARRKAEAARTMLAEGIDPSEQRKASKAAVAAAREAEELKAQGIPMAGSFEAVAREWYSVKQSAWAPTYGEKIIRRLEVDVFPWIGGENVGSVTPPQLLQVMRRIEARGVIETAHRALENCSQVFRYAVATGRAESNPARDLKDALKKPEPKNFPAITDPTRLGQLLRASDNYVGTPVVRAALKLAPMLMLRPGELRMARWCEFDLDAALWTVPAVRMKREKRGKLLGPPHLVPLPKQAIEVLQDLQPLTGAGEFVFRGERHHERPMSENTVNAALRAMGFPADEVTGHGFRATARTMLHERLGFDPDVIEAQLAHVVRDSLGRAYNRTQFVDQRRKMMQAWANYLDKLRKGAEVRPLRGRAA